MNKKIITLILLTISLNILAGKGIIIVHEAPLLEKRDTSSLVLQTFPKGEKIYIHSNEFPENFHAVNYKTKTLSLAWDRPDFFTTVTRDGREAYVPSRYVKLIINDSNEFSKKVTIEDDPTDYRIHEPLPDGYPLLDPYKARTFFMGGFGPGRKSTYNTGELVSKESESYRMGVEFSYASKVSFDKYERLYFGGLFHIYTTQSETLLTDDRIISESHTEFGAGPLLTYDFYRTKKTRLFLRGALFANFNRFLVSQEDSSENTEQAFFNGYSFGGKIGTFWNYRNIIPESKVDFILGLDMTGDLPFSLSSSKDYDISSYWQSNNISFSSSVIYSAYIGVQGNY